MAAPEDFAERYIVRSLPRFLAAHPGIDVELVEAAAPAELIAESIDLAIRIAETVAPTMVVRRIGASRAVIVAAPSYLAAANVPVVPAGLVYHQCIGFSPLAWRETWRLGVETVTVKPRLLSNSSISLRNTAIAGLGLVALPDWCLTDALAAGQLERVLAEFETPQAGIYALYPTNFLLTPGVGAFVDHIAGNLRARGVPSWPASCPIASAYFGNFTQFRSSGLGQQV